MNRCDFQKLIGATAEETYLPVAVVLRNAYACAGNYRSAVNDGLTDLCLPAHGLAAGIDRADEL